jgi:3-hydroxyacyl-CoA dehydrogenase
MSLVNYETRGSIAVITVHNPPVNALSVGVPRGIVEALETGNADNAVRAFVLIGAGRGFIAGADIREFGKPLPPGEPTLHDTISAFETSAKPVVAAIHGNALGGGLETAMGCHYRVSVANANLGQPEVKLGFPPGAGGTQRLPRLIGMRKALDMVVGGSPIKASEGQTLGLIDRVIDGDLLTGAIEFAEDMLAKRDAHPTVGERALVIEEPDLFEKKRKAIARRAGGRRAPYACIECLEAAATLSFREGLAREHAIFEEMVASDESNAMRHIFFAERQASKIPGLPKGMTPRAIESGAVIGAGTMGVGIAMSFASAGIPVLITDNQQESLKRGMQTVVRNYAATVKKGRLTQSDMDRCMALITPAAALDDVRDADMVIEAVFEEMSLKKEMFKRLDGICKPGAIIASNTSYLDINEMAAETRRPELVLGTHFFSPANIMRLVEVVRTTSCSDETLATTMALVKRMRKIGVVSGVCDGFIANRMAVGYRREAWFLLEEGALPHDIDRVMESFGMAMGPLAVGDLAGLDIGWRKRRAEEGTRDPNVRYSTVADRLCEQGRFGQKTGGGFYRYEEGSRTRQRDETVEQMIVDLSAELGIERRPIGDDEILERCLYPLINEGAKILEEGIALRASDIDITWVTGMGFPDYRGGPMFYAEQKGLPEVYKTMCRYQEQQGDLWQPSALLRDLAESGRSFSDR